MAQLNYFDKLAAENKFIAEQAFLKESEAWLSAQRLANHQMELDSSAREDRRKEKSTGSVTQYTPYPQPVPQPKTSVLADLYQTIKDLQNYCASLLKRQRTVLDRIQVLDQQIADVVVQIVQATQRMHSVMRNHPACHLMNQEALENLLSQFLAHMERHHLQPTYQNFAWQQHFPKNTKQEHVDDLLKDLDAEHAKLKRLEAHKEQLDKARDVATLEYRELSEEIEEISEEIEVSRAKIESIYQELRNTRNEGENRVGYRNR